MYHLFMSLLAVSTHKNCSSSFRVHTATLAHRIHHLLSGLIRRYMVPFYRRGEAQTSVERSTVFCATHDLKLRAVRSVHGAFVDEFWTTKDLGT
jgi:hypothetical protein